ncbi:hypothetical protein A2V68_00795 [candidate division Kazan bacterium RBG_13_50_9]|uniref:Uncharacterized protein n=1 Tax=candidate division Kazan bacterium RBG_13_50_9 TaxID=1798535 RepID=A0A1F4NS23_UNCK3|nr:MAG: hypothetical protein A2V68_00795 [candidate division Kazan bacterium RBG_13_50_9]
MRKLQTISTALVATAVTMFSQVEAVLAQVSPPSVGQSSGNIKDIIVDIGNWILGIAGAIAVLWLIYGGIMYITGGEKGAESGKKIIINAIIGLAIIGLASLIARAVVVAIGA